MIICSNCQQPGEESSAFCGYCGVKIPAANQRNESQLKALATVASDNEIIFKANSVAEAQIALEKLESKKEELTLDKKKLTEKESQIRANHAAALENRGNLFQSSENAGRFVRVLQTASRDAAQRNLEHELAPYQEQIRKIEATQSALEEQILEVKSFIQKNSQEP